MNVLRKLYPNICTLDVYLTRIFGVANSGKELEHEPAVWWKHTDDSAAFQLLLSSTLVCYHRQPASLSAPAVDSDAKGTASIGRHTEWIHDIIATLNEHGARSEHSNNAGLDCRAYMEQHRDKRVLVNELKSMSWCILSQRIGKQAFSHILKQVALFRAIPGQCIYQLWGYSIERLLSTAQSKSLSNRRLGNRNSDKTTTYKLERRNMLYTRYVPCKNHRVVFGFASQCLLSQVNPTSDMASMSTHLLSSIFPSEFNTRKRRKSRRLSVKTPWRLKGAEALVEEMIRRTARCNITGLLLCHCPMTWNTTQLKEVSALNASTTYHKVTSFVRSVIRHIIPVQLWGSKENEKAILAGLAKFIAYKQRETLSIDELMNGFKISHCTWIGTSEGGKHQHKTPTESAKQRSIAIEWIRWVFETFVVSLIQGCFYVTESGVFKSRLFYFRHDIWKKITDAHLRQTIQSRYTPVMKTSIRQVASRIRLIPKALGLRSIASQPILSARSNTKLQLDGLHDVLKFIKTTKEEPFFGPISGWVEIAQKINAYQRHLNLSSQCTRPLCFFRIDIKNSFDTIPKDRLITAIRQMISNEYSLHKYTTLVCAEGKLNVQSKTCASYPLTKLTLEAFIRETKPRPVKGIITNSQLDTIESGQTLLNLLMNHINNHCITIGNKLYRQNIGLPQGSMLSTILCILYYSQMCREVIVNKHPDDFFVHYVDDFLYISPDEERARHFYQHICQAFPPYGCHIQSNKSLSNFDADSIIRLPVYAKEFPWCGLLINMNSLDVRWQHDRFQLDSLRNTTRLDRISMSCQSILERLKGCMHSYLDPLVMSEDINSRTTLLSNVFRAYYGIANRLYLVLATHCNKANRAIFNKIVMPLIHFCNQFMRKRYETIQFCEVKWLALYAFLVVFEARPTKYALLVDSLRSIVYHSRYKHLRYRLINLARVLNRELSAY